MPLSKSKLQPPGIEPKPSCSGVGCATTTLRPRYNYRHRKPSTYSISTDADWKIVHILMWAFLGKDFVHQILNIFTFDCEDGRIFLAIFLKVYLLLSTAALPDRTTYNSSAATTQINRPTLLLKKPTFYLGKKLMPKVIQIQKSSMWGA